MTKDKYSIPMNPFLGDSSDELFSVEEQLERAVSAVNQLHAEQHKSSELVHQGQRIVVSEAAEFCTQFLSDAEFALIEQGNVFGNSEDNNRLAKLQNYSNEVKGLLVRLSLDAGIYGWRRSAYLRTVLFVKAYGWQTLLLLSLAGGSLYLTSTVSKLIFLPAESTDTRIETKAAEAEKNKQISFVAVKAGQDLIASNNQTYEVFAEGILLARQGSSGVARLDSTVIVTSGAQAEVYGLAYAYNGATIVLYPGGRVYAEPGAHVDNRGGELITLKEADWPLRYRRH